MKNVLIFIFLISLTSCFRGGDVQMKQKVQPLSMYRIQVLEVIQGAKYTYLRASENDKIKWLAVSKQEIKVGDTYYFDKALQMNNFFSKELNKTFDVIYFVSDITTKIKSGTTIVQSEAHSGKVQSDQKKINLDKKTGELTIAELFENRSKYSGQKVKIKGLVVKVNKAVSGKNWIHIQDGTSSGRNFDLTITSQDIAEINEVAVFEGIITLNKNFGSGYFYELMMENAVKIVSR